MIYFVGRPQDQSVAYGHIGENLFSDKHSVNNVSYVQADGDELELCWKMLGRTGNSPNRVHIFVGDDAKEIALHWKR